MGTAKYVTTFDLIKGYWQVTITERPKKFFAFVTPQGLYQCEVMVFGMKNAPATFRRFINNFVVDLPSCSGTSGYLDELIIYSDTREDHLYISYALFDKLDRMKLKS